MAPKSVRRRRSTSTTPKPRAPKAPSLEVTLEAFSNVVACSLPTARGLLRDGCPSRGRQGRALRIPLQLAVPWVIQRQKTRFEQALADARTETPLNVERVHLARAQRKLAELKARELEGELVKAADADRALTAVTIAAKAQLLAVPRRAVHEGVPSEFEPTMKRLLVDALRELAAVTTLRELEAIGRVEGRA